MKNIKTVGIIGAGLSGLVTAKTCLEYGYNVKVFEKEIEVGGVWASSRRYPGITTQNTKDTYCFSDFPMPKNFPQWPSGEQVQLYFTDYAKKFKVLPLIKFSHEITNVSFNKGSWTIAGKNPGSNFSEQTDFLIVCNGTFSDPFIPKLKGEDSFIKAGGVILHSTEFHSTETSRDKQLVVVGYGKSATDLVTAASETAKSALLVFREPKWKIPRFIKGINMKYLLLNRLGESFIKPGEQHNKLERFIHKIGFSEKMLSFMEKYSTKKQMLKELGLVPASSLKEQSFGEIALETPQFFERIKSGKIIARQGEVIGFKERTLVFSNLQEIECDVIVFAAGFKQTIPFLPAEMLEKFTDEGGNYVLYHHILPAGVPSLAFVGYNSSIQCPISSEFAALWVCEYLKGRILAPSEAQIYQEGISFIKWRLKFRPNGASRGLSTMPGTIHHVDMLLKEMNASLPIASLIPDWLITINPSRYRKIRNKIASRNNK